MSQRRAQVLLAAFTLAAAIGIALVIKPGISGRLWRLTVRNPQLAAKARPFQTTLLDALAGYNASDPTILFADFATDATPPPTPETHRALFEGYYKATLGNYVSQKLNFEDTSIGPDTAVLVLRATFEKRPDVAVFAHFTRREHDFKIMQLRFHENQPSPP